MTLTVRFNYFVIIQVLKILFDYILRIIPFDYLNQVFSELQREELPHHIDIGGIIPLIHRHILSK